MPFRPYYPAATRKKRRHCRLFWILPLVLCLPACLAGLIAVSPVLLVFWHALHLPGSSFSIQEELELLADLKIVESSEHTDEPVDVVHSLTVTIPEEAVEQMLSDALDQEPGPFMKITSVVTRISLNRIVIDFDVEYTLGGHTVFATAFTSKWNVRTSPALLAAPMPTVVELSPATIGAAYWPSVEWMSLWQAMTRQHAQDGWLPLEFTASFRLEELILEEGQLVLAIAPGTFR